jgi:UDP-N-acetylglucosamine 2-epimerase
MHFFKNLPIDTYVKMMRHAACLVGNSSSGIREGAYIGTPVVNIGTRQQRRLAGSNVLHAPHDADSIRKAIERQLEHGRYPMEPIYGEGKAGERIADILSYKTVSSQKLITY